MTEKLIGGFMTDKLARGDWGTYGIYVTTDRIIGVKGTWQVQFDSPLESILFKPGSGIVVGGSSLATGAGVTAKEAVEEREKSKGTLEGGGHVAKAIELSEDESPKAIKLLDEKKDLEVSKQDIEEIRLEGKEKKGLKKLFGGWGTLTIKTPKETYTLKVSGVKGGIQRGAVQMLKDLFTAFDKDKFVVEEK